MTKRRLVNLASLARSETASAVKVLANIVRHPKSPTAARVAAAVALLDRGWGKPAQSHKVVGAGEGGAIEVVIRDLMNERRVREFNED